ncbi:MAG: tRNA (adenosine(37)-N6)-threonylcarbamoyltransferase complex dimerization subunit type 1 TsaB [Candidatus Gastranaerophilales bacterium]|nr:tRNA (adenosine(37)-N6)-threonylcarbamoyltransferase complex dimerization subunit type 1 TsaB [Candidatus Gastranaerophilales bacterium]
MNILAICSALNNSYLAIKAGNEVLSKIIKSDEKNYHSLYLIQEIKNLCNKINFSLNELDFITTNLGPGSFTGIRVSLTVAKVMAQELNLPLVGLNSSVILLTAYDCDYLVMDARRDMYYIGTKEKIELVYKDKIPALEGKILTDKRSSDIIKNSICFEDNDKNIGEVMIKLANSKFENSKNKDEFNYLNVNANYIQTPPVFTS